jgi:hypothetical protein
LLFEANQNSLPMMVGSNLKRLEVIRCLVDAFGGCSARIRRLGKEIGCRRIPQISSKDQNSISLPSQSNQTQWPPNAPTRPLISSYPFRLLPNIKGSQGRMNPISSLCDKKWWEKITHIVYFPSRWLKPPIPYIRRCKTCMGKGKWCSHPPTSVCKIKFFSFQSTPAD